VNKNTTKSNKNKQLLFSFNQSAVADFKGGKISSDGGLVLLREFDDKISFIKGLNKRINDPRNPFFIIHEQEELLRQRIFQIALGYEDADDSDLLRLDPLFQVSVKNGKKAVDELASQPTITRMENRVCEKDLGMINDFLLDTYIKSTKSGKKSPKRIVLDIDSTDDPTHGNQQMSMFHGYYEQTMYHPLIISELTSKLMLGAFLRAGNVHTAHNVLEYLSPIVKKLKEQFPNVEITLRQDSGFSSSEMYNFCKDEDLSFAIGIAGNDVLYDKIHARLEEVRKEFKKNNGGKEENDEIEPVRTYVSFNYKAKSWKRQQRVVAKIEKDKHKEDIRFVATNLKGKSQEIYEFYTKRGDCENRIEELKNGFNADRLSCHDFRANYFRLLLHVCAYNFISLLRSNLNNSELAEAKIDTIRLKLLKVGAWINKTFRRIWIHFSSSWPFMDLFNELYEKIKKSPQYCLS
jgi:hypothetical protein